MRSFAVREELKCLIFYTRRKTKCKNVFKSNNTYYKVLARVRVAEDLVLLRHDAASMGPRIPTFRNHVVFCPSRAHRTSKKSTSRCFETWRSAYPYRQCHISEEAALKYCTFNIPRRSLPGVQIATT